MDTVELVMAVEDAFKIHIADEDAEKILTVGQLRDYVLSRLNGGRQPESRCLNAVAFNRIRRELMSCFRVPRRTIRPDTPLEALIPPKNRRSEWRRLERSLGWQLPSLRRPSWVNTIASDLAIVWAFSPLLLFLEPIVRPLQLYWPLFFAVYGGTLLLVYTFWKLTEPLARDFPTQTLRGLVPMALGANLARIEHPGTGWTPSGVWEVIVAIISYQAGVPAESITDSMSFVNDLGLD